MLRRFLSSSSTGQTYCEKVAQKYALGLGSNRKVRPGDILAVSPQHVMTHDNTGAVMIKFLDFFKGTANPDGVFYDAKQPVFTLDHNVQDKSPKNLKKYAEIEAFAKRHGVTFYPAGRGIGHQIMCEEAYAWPGTMVVASDSHSNMYGGLGCLGTPVVRTDAASIWATGETWLQMPPSAKVWLTGSLRPGVTGKDVILTLCSLYNKDEVLNHFVEFLGPGAASLDIDSRLTIANMTTEWGALAGVFLADGATVDWLEAQMKKVSSRHPRLTRARLDALSRAVEGGQLVADSGAQYAVELELDLGEVVPQAAGPNMLKKSTAVADLKADDKPIAIQKAYLVSCVNSRASDLRAAADVVRAAGPNAKVAAGVEFYVAAASSEVQKESEAAGDWQALLAAGVHPLPAGCGPCIGLGAGLLKEGEVGISATNRNFKGRMGHRNAEVYLASPATVTASALRGYITFHDKPVRAKAPVKPSVRTHQLSQPPAQQQELVAGFPQRINTSLVYCREDNINTDAIYPGKYTYDDAITPTQQAQVVMENYDPDFAKRIPASSILVAGFNFGTGSSREQAATALKYRGVKLLLAGSFSETFKRNALNNGLLCLEAPGLATFMKENFGKASSTVILSQEDGLGIDVDFEAGTISCVWKDKKSQNFPLMSVSAVAQELVVSGGQEAWVKKRLGISS